MIKSKLIRLETGKRVDELANVFINLQFRQGKNCGIDLLDYNSQQLQARFIEEVVINERQVDPFGIQIENKIIRFYVFEFSVIELKPHQFLIKIDSPPRSLKAFTNMLQSSLGFGVSIFNLNLNLFNLLSEIGNQPNYKNWQLKKMRISGVKLSLTSVSKIELLSLDDAYQDAKKVINLENTTIEKVFYSIREPDKIATLEISNTGLLVGDESSVNDLVKYIEGIN